MVLHSAHGILINLGVFFLGINSLIKLRRKKLKRGIIQLVIILVYALTVIGCQNNDQTPAPTENVKSNNNANVSTSQSETYPNKGIMIAKVNGTAITSAEVDQELNNIMAPYQNSVPPEQLQMLRPKMRNKAIENLINKLLLFHEADRKKIQPSPDEINTELNSIISRFPSPEAFQQQLTKMGITKDKVLKDIEQQLKISILLKESLADLKTTITDGEITEFYQGNPENFRAQEQVRASHVLLKINPEDSPDIKSQKRVKLAGLRDQIQNGADFAKIAEGNSDCPSKQQGGDLGFFERGRMVKPFEEAAFNLKTGELSEIVETQFGYHLIKVVDRKEARTVPLEEVKDKISAHLKNVKERQAFITYLEKLREGASIEYAEAGK